MQQHELKCHPNYWCRIASGQTIATFDWHSVYMGDGLTRTDRQENAEFVALSANHAMKLKELLK